MFTSDACYQCGREAYLAIHAAAINGHLEVAKYIHARVDTPLTRNDEKEEEERQAETFKALGRRLGEKNNAGIISGITMLRAAERGFLDVMQWLHSEFSVDPAHDLYGGHGLDDENEITIMDAAATKGHLDILQYLHDIGKSFKPRIRQKRKRSDDLDSMYDFFEIRVPGRGRRNTVAPKCTTKAMDGAAAHGHLAIVRWLHEHRTEDCTTAAMDLAAEHGHLEMVQWLHTNRKEGCSASAMDGAASSSHLPIVKWLNEHRNEGCTTKAMDGAAGGGHIEVVHWLSENRSEGCTTAAMDGAAGCGALEAVKWLHRNRMEGCTTAAMDEAARNGHIRVIRWLHENRKEGCTNAAMDNAAMVGEFEAVLLLHKLRITTGAGRIHPSSNDVTEWLDERYP